MAVLTDAQIFGSIGAVTKDFYLPAFKNDVNLTLSPLVSGAPHYNVSGNKIVTAMETGMNGGVGFGVDGEKTPASGRQMFGHFEEKVKDIYCNIEISDKTVKAAKKGGSIIDVLDSEMKGSLAAAKFQVGRSVYGNGSGIIAYITASTGKTATVNDAKYLMVGATVDVYATGGTIKAERVRIVKVDRGANQVTLSENVGTTTGFITLQGSYNNELTGLGSIFDDKITTLYGVDKSSNYYMKPIVVDAEKDINDTKIREALRDSENYNNGDVNMIVCGNKAYDAYATYLRENGYRIENSAMELKGGFTGIEFMSGNKKVAIVDDRFVPDSEMWGFNKESIGFYDLADWGFVEYSTGGIFTLVPGTSIYRGLLACYTNIICKNPGGCVRIKNVCDGSSLESLMYGTE